MLILEEAAYCDPGFFYETVAPLLIVGRTSLLCISTLTSSINFYTRLIKMVDPHTQEKMFTVMQVELACDRCKEEGKQTDCVHMLHLVPSWQSGEKHRRLKVIMQDRPDLLESELSGMAFDALQQVFRQCDIDTMMTQIPPALELREDLFIIVDPAAGGPQSDYAIMTMTRKKGLITVRTSNVCTPSSLHVSNPKPLCTRLASTAGPLSWTNS